MKRRDSTLIFTGLASLVAAWWLAQPGERALLGCSFQLALWVELLVLPVAFALAFFLARTRCPQRATVGSLLASLLFIPLYLQVTGWDGAFGRLGWYTLSLGDRTSPLLHGFRAAVLLHAVYALPWSTLLMAAAFREGHPDGEEQALQEGSAWQVCFWVTLPQCAGGLLLGSVWTLLLTVGDMTVTNIYLVRTYTENIYSHFAASGDLSAVVPHALPLIAGVAGLLLLAAGSLPGHRAASERGAPYLWSCGGAAPFLSAVALLLVALPVAIPLVNLLVLAGMEVKPGDAHPVRVWSTQKCVEIIALIPWRFAREFRDTALLSAGVMLAAVASGACLAWWVRGTSWQTSGLTILSAAALAIPAPLAGAAVILLLNQPAWPALTWLYDRTLLPPLLAILLRAAPLSFLLFRSAWETLDRRVLEAAALEGATRWQVFRHVAWPQRRGVVIAAGIAFFALAAGDLAASLLTLPPGMSTISQRMFGLVHSGVDDQLAGLGLWCWMFCLLVALIAQRPLKSLVR